MANKRQKSPEMLVDKSRGRGRGLSVVEPAVRSRPPAAPPGLSPYARAVWRAFWRAPVALAVDMQADKERLHHWIACVDERERISKLAVNQPLLKGSKGNLLLNPLFRRV